jgi:hypothetical protein
MLWGAGRAAKGAPGRPAEKVSRVRNALSPRGVLVSGP